MRAFKLIEMNDRLVVAINCPKLAAAVRAFDYAWEEHDGGEGETTPILEALDQLYVKTAGETPSH